MAFYYYSTSNQQSYGPYRGSEIRSMLAAGSATLEDYVSEDGENWTPIQEWMQQAPREEGDKSRRTHTKQRKRARARRSRYSSKNKHSGYPGEARETTSKVIWMIILFLLVMVGGAVWLYLEAEKKQAQYQSSPLSGGEEEISEPGGEAVDADPSGAEASSDEKEAVSPVESDVQER